MDTASGILTLFSLPETYTFLAFLFFTALLWLILRRLKRLRETVVQLELGRLEAWFQSTEMRRHRLRLIISEPTDLKALQARSEIVLAFFDRLGFFVQRGTLPREEVWQIFGPVVRGYFSFLFPFLQWLRTEQRTPELYGYFEDLNAVLFRLNRKVQGKKARPLMEEEELRRFLEEERSTLEEAALSPEG